MSLPTYPLATGTVPLVATDVNQAVAWRHGPGRQAVRLGLGTGDWFVTGEHGFIARIDETSTARYPDMSRVFQSGFAAGAIGELTLRDDNSGGLAVTVWVPAAPFLVPVGQLEETVDVLAQGAPLSLDLAVEFATACQALVELDAVGERLVALLDGRLIGGLVSPPPPLLEATRTRRLAARAFILGDTAVLDISTSLSAAPLPALRVPAPPVFESPALIGDPDVFVPAADIDLEPAEKQV